MPKYSFLCTECDNLEQLFVDVGIKTVVCPKCSSVANRQMPKLNGAVEVRETVDSTTNRKHKQNQKDLIKERNDEYFWKVEVPRLVQKYSTQTALEEGWIWIDDKGQVHVHDKPPGKR